MEKEIHEKLAEQDELSQMVNQLDLVGAVDVLEDKRDRAKMKL